MGQWYTPRKETHEQMYALSLIRQVAAQSEQAQKEIARAKERRDRSFLTKTLYSELQRLEHPIPDQQWFEEAVEFYIGYKS